MVAICKRLLNLKSRNSGPVGKFERPRVTGIVNYTIDVYASNVPGTDELFRERLENLVSEFGCAYITHHRTGLAAVGAKVPVHKLFMLEIFFPTSVPPVRPEPTADGELNP